VLGNKRCETYEAVRKYSDPLLISLSFCHDDLLSFEINVFHPQSQALNQAQSCAV